MLPFMVGTAFLTNVFYLPYLGLRGMHVFCAHASSKTRSKEREEGGCVPAAGYTLALGCRHTDWRFFPRDTGPNPTLWPAADDADAKAVAVGESKSLPVVLVGVFAASVAWGCLGRGGGEFGDVATRWNALVDMALHTDRLAHSFLIDSLTFWAFQVCLRACTLGCGAPGCLVACRAHSLSPLCKPPRFDPPPLLPVLLPERRVCFHPARAGLYQMT